MSRLILVSNRLPVQLRGSGRRQSLMPSSGGLVAGLGPIHERGNGLWIGTLGAPASAGLRRELADQRLIALELPEREAAQAYEGFSNQVLWPLFHYLIARIAFDPADFEAYCEVNRRFADAVVSVAQPGDAVWVHDYHLMLLPALLRERLPDASIGFFLHIPFPSSEVFRILPRKERILTGLLGADLVGLHTYDYARHLVTSFRRILGIEFDDRWISLTREHCRIGVFPLGVDARGLRESASSPEVEQRLAELRREVPDRKVIIGVDRMDYTKGLPLRLSAFRRLLEREPAWRARALLLQLIVPSRSNISDYRLLKEEVERQIGAINGLFAHGGRTPIQYLYRGVPKAELMAMFRLADVAFITPVRDGMNLVAKEYVSARPDNSGVLVLSEFAGAASEMGEALLVNPWDIDATSEALARALTMGRDEAQKRMAALRKRNEANDVNRWVEGFLTALSQAHALRRPRVSAEEGWQQACIAAFSTAAHALLVLDYGGTIADIAPTPGEARPTLPAHTMLKVLGSMPNVEVVVVSGRDPSTLESWLADLPLHLVAEHGLLCRFKGEVVWRELMPGLDLSWKPALRAVLDSYAARAPGVLVEDKGASFTWHYRLVEPAFGEWLARELAQHLVESFAAKPIEVHAGKKALEVRPYGVSKGRAYRVLVERLGPFDFTLAAGDDRSDEDLFEALPQGAWSILVGDERSRARFRVESPARLRDFLERLGRRPL
jgi:trehalose 6-phosphate synthase/phosphatase